MFLVKLVIIAFMLSVVKPSPIFDNNGFNNSSEHEKIIPKFQGTSNHSTSVNSTSPTIGVEGFNNSTKNFDNGVRSSTTPVKGLVELKNLSKISDNKTGSIPENSTLKDNKKCHFKMSCHNKTSVQNSTSSITHSKNVKPPSNAVKNVFSIPKRNKYPRPHRHGMGPCGSAHRHNNKWHYVPHHLHMKSGVNPCPAHKRKTKDDKTVAQVTGEKLSGSNATSSVGTSSLSGTKQNQNKSLEAKHKSVIVKRAAEEEVDISSSYDLNKDPEDLGYGRGPASIEEESVFEEIFIPSGTSFEDEGVQRVYPGMDEQEGLALMK